MTSVADQITVVVPDASANVTVTPAQELTVTVAPTTELVIQASNIGEKGDPGVPGVPGPPGADSVVPGPQGPAGPGVPVGGTVGQVLTKIDASDYNTQWAAASGGDLSAYQLRSEEDHAGGYVGLDSNSAVSIAGPLTTRQGAATQIKLDGAITLGLPGSSVSLFSPQTQTLKTDVFFQAAASVKANVGAASQVEIGQSTISGSSAGLAALMLGNPGDAIIYRAGANSLKSDALLSVGLDLVARDGTASQVKVGDVSGKPMITFGSVGPASLYFQSGLLTTDKPLQSLGEIFARGQGNVGTVVIGQAGGSGQAGFRLGATGDTSLYRSAANVLRTDGTLDANALTINGVPVGGGGGLPADTVVPSGTRIIANKLLAGDAQPNWRLDGSGKLEWGAGGALATDATLYRQAAGILKTDGSIYLGQQPTGPGLVLAAGGNNQSFRAGMGGVSFSASVYGDANLRWFVNPTGQINWGAGPTASDTTLYRSAAGVLTTDGRMTAKDSFAPFVAAPAAVGNYAFGVYPGSDTSPFFGIRTDGRMEWAARNSASDTNLYRSAASTLKTDTAFHCDGQLMAHWTGSAYAINTTQFPGEGFQFTGDTNLYRSAAGNLKTDGSFSAGQSVIVDASNGSNKLYLGGALDTYLYRSAAGVLKTDGNYVADQNIVARFSTPAAQVGVGNYGPGNVAGVLFASDTNLYRFGANQLMTDGYLYTGQAAYFMRGSATQVGIVAQGGTQAALAFGSAGDAILYREAAQTLRANLALKVDAWAMIGAANSDTHLYFGGGFDTNLYRYAGAVLKTDGQFYVTSYVAAAQGTAGQATTGGVGPSGAAGIQLGGAGDVTLYRNSATELKSNVTITAPNVNVQGTNGVMLFGEAGVPKGGSAGSFKITVDGATYYVPFYA